MSLPCADKPTDSASGSFGKYFISPLRAFRRFSAVMNFCALVGRRKAKWIILFNILSTATLLGNVGSAFR